MTRRALLAWLLGAGLAIGQDIQSGPKPCEVQASRKVPVSRVQNGKAVVTETVEVPVSKAAPPPPPAASVWELWHYTDGSTRWTLVQRTAPFVESYPVPNRFRPMPARMPAFAAQIQLGQFQAGACYGST